MFSASDIKAADDNEILLGELIFSSRDPRLEVAQEPEAYDDKFCDFVTAKAEASDDLEERVALKSLAETIKAVRAQIAKNEEEAKKASQKTDVEEEKTARGAIPSNAEILRSAQSTVAFGASATKEEKRQAQILADEKSEAGLSGAALETYDVLLRDLLHKSEDADILASAIEANFDSCDLNLLNLATSRKNGGDERAGRVLEAVNAATVQKLQMATQRLGSVLKAGAPEKMFAKIIELATVGAVDRAFLELLDANRQQALNAGATEAALLMKRLGDRAKDELDKKYAEEPEKKLLRALLRCGDDAKARELLLRKAFEPKEKLELNFDGEATKGGPDVAPPAFIAACQTLIKDFGNIDDVKSEQFSGSLSERLLAIADQAEQIAVSIFGESMTPKEQQDQVWNEGTTSVFDLEAAEMAAETQGDRMPWQDDSYDDMLPPGFDKASGIKRVGGG